MSEFLDTTVEIHQETDRAILASEDGDEGSAVWLPLSQIEINARRGSVADISVPGWLAEERGLA